MRQHAAEPKRKDTQSMYHPHSDTVTDHEIPVAGTKKVLVFQRAIEHIWFSRYNQVMAVAVARRVLQRSASGRPLKLTAWYRVCEVKTGDTLCWNIHHGKGMCRMHYEEARNPTRRKFKPSALDEMPRYTHTGCGGVLQPVDMAGGYRCNKCNKKGNPNLVKKKRASANK